MTEQNVENIKRLRQQRGILKGQLTRLNNSFSPDNVYSETDIIKLRMQLDRVTDSLNTFDNIQLELELLDTSECEERESFEALYYTTIAEIRNFLNNRGQSVTTSINNANVELQVARNVRLPNINLPHFSGDYTEWRHFYELFNSLVHSDNNLHAIHKFHYLKASLSKIAASVIESIEVTAENYEIAFNLLKARFENKRLLIYNHVKALFDLPNLEKENHVKLRELTDNLQKHLRALHSLNQPTDYWDTLVVYLISNKLDNITRKEWENTTSNSDFPTLADMTQFLNARCSLLERMTEQKLTSDKKHIIANHKQRVVSYVSSEHKTMCKLCHENHYLYKCNSFLQKSISDRINSVRNLKLCLNCLRSGHNYRECKSSKCRKCNQSHNTLLHIAQNEQSQSNENNISENISQQTFSVSNNCVNKTPSSKQILLSTAIVDAIGKNGKTIQLRTLLDSASQSNFITKDKCRELQLPTRQISIPVSGINQQETIIKEMVTLKIKSRVNSYELTISCLVIPRITENMPSSSFHNQLNIPRNLINNLADPLFYQSNPIHILLGSEIFWSLLNVGQISLGANMPIMQKTLLGWVLGGPICTDSNLHKKLNYASTTLEQQLQKFWEIDNAESTIPNSKLTFDESVCEDIFIQTYRRNEMGRFIVDLPFKQPSLSLGESRHLAINKFKSLETRLDKNSELKLEYHKFIREYLELGHMEEVPLDEISKENYYLPHHPVIKDSSSTTRLRVVFNASAKSSNGLSLNQNLLIGPKLQNDIFSILLNFRLHKYVLLADCTKMYRQILINPKHCDFQRIVWRNNKTEPIKDYRLLTVTYGTSSAPYLAIRCLNQLAEEEKMNFPLAHEAIRNDFYVDDLITGRNVLVEAIELRDQIINCLNKAGFHLRKWSANHPELLPIDSHHSIHNIDHFINFTDTGEINTLGLLWNNRDDILKYSANLSTIHSQKVTKRTILSIIAKLYDPLGLLGPVLTQAKHIMQKLWSLQLHWDESVPLTIHTEWKIFLSQLDSIQNLHINRRVISDNEIVKYELHGFSDASKIAYGCCIYLRTTDIHGNHSNHLLCAKSRVAPLKPLTIPRLELCGAVLLAKLYAKVIAKFKIPIHNYYMWTDSTIVLGWILSSSTNFNVFITNRLIQIKDLTDSSNWRHVRSEQNPADLISRGVKVDRLINSELWWTGPEFLTKCESHWPSTVNNIDIDELPELRKTVLAVTTNNSGPILDCFSKYSSFTKLLRIIGYCLRFIYNSNPINVIKYSGNLKSFELFNSEVLIIKFVQAEAFAYEVQTLKVGREIDRSKILNLRPFLDSNGLLRVGGRLSNSSVSYNQKFPIILPSNHVITKLIIKNIHLKYLHAGTEATLSAIRMKYWPISGRSTVRNIIYKCVTCFKAKPKSLEQLMGNLPQERVEPCKPFIHTGIDYCGPFQIIKHRGRGSKLIKVWVAVFVCLATKATHIELVTDCTAEAFLNALKRFMSRRGSVSKLFSDNSTTFVGARAQLKKIFKLLISDYQVTRYISCNNIEWQTIPARSPHRGGLWEGAIKSIKYHLRRVLGKQIITYEELYTLLTQIEACLNSRPITYLSSDSTDFTALTPGHFLVGEPLISVVEPDIKMVNTNCLTRWKRVQQMYQHFWKRFQREYLHQMQQRTKWIHRRDNKLKPGDLVILMDEQPPLNWKMGRILDVHVGSDQLVRSASIRTQTGVVTRSINKLCLLPS